MYFLDAGECQPEEEDFVPPRRQADKKEIEALEIAATEFVEWFNIQIPIPEVHPGISPPLIFHSVD